MNYLDLVKLAAPEIAVVITALVVLAIGLTTSRRVGHATVSATKPEMTQNVAPDRMGQRLCTFAAALGLVIAIGVVFTLPENANFLGGMLVVSPLTSLFKIICLSLAFFTVLLSYENSSMRNRGEYLAMLLLATVGLLLLVGSEQLLMIFVGLELTGLSLYVMAGFDKTDIRSAEAGLKYFLFGSTASAFTLFGLSLVYGMSGATGLAAIAQKVAGEPVSPLLAAGMVMTLIGFAFKIAAAPFHLWAPDAYQGAPVASAAFIASGSKVASFFVLGKIVLIGFGPLAGSAAWHTLVAGWMPMLAALAAFSILLGNLVALAQRNLRRLLAYSAVAHAGYTLLGLVAGGRDGFSATLFYTTVYAVTLIGAFAIVGIVRRETGGDDIAHFSGLSSRSPLLAAVDGCLHALVGRAASVGGIFREVLSLQCRISVRLDSRPRLVSGPGSLRQPDFALLLLDRAEGDIRGRSAGGPSFDALRVVAKARRGDTRSHRPDPGRSPGHPRRAHRDGPSLMRNRPDKTPDRPRMSPVLSVAFRV